MPRAQFIYNIKDQALYREPLLLTRPGGVNGAITLCLCPLLLVEQAEKIGSLKDALPAFLLPVLLFFPGGINRPPEIVLSILIFETRSTKSWGRSYSLPITCACRRTA